MVEEKMGQSDTKVEACGGRGAGVEPKTAGPSACAGWIACLVLALIGLALSGELARLHFEAVSNPEYRSYCSVNDMVSCDAVTRSKYSVVFGVPLAIWGVFGYTAMAIAAVFGLRTRSREAAAPFATLTGFALVVAVILAGISHLRIHAWCLLCIGTYVVNVASSGIAFRLLTKQGARASYGALWQRMKEDRRRTIAIAALLGVAALALILFFPAPHASAVLVPPMLQDSTATKAGSSAASEGPGALPESSAAASSGSVATSASSASASSAPASSAPAAIPPLPPGVRVERGVTSDGLPWIGAAAPVVTVIEFFDYECSHCRQAFHGLHELLELNPDRLRLVVRHFPLDQHCNRFIRRQVYEHSCSNAMLANCAKEQRRFWEAHEYLFDHSEDIVESKAFASALKLDAKALNACLNRPDEALRRDIEAGIELDLHGTPVFVVDGKPYMQHLPRSVVAQLRLPPDRR